MPGTHISSVESYSTMVVLQIKKFMSKIESMQPAEIVGLVEIPSHIRFWGIDSGIRHR